MLLFDKELQDLVLCCVPCCTAVICRAHRALLGLCLNTYKLYNNMGDVFLAAACSLAIRASNGEQPRFSATLR